MSVISRDKVDKAVKVASTLISRGVSMSQIGNIQSMLMRLEARARMGRLHAEREQEEVESIMRATAIDDRARRSLLEAIRESMKEASSRGESPTVSAATETVSLIAWCYDAINDTVIKEALRTAGIMRIDRRTRPLVGRMADRMEDLSILIKYFMNPSLLARESGLRPKQGPIRSRRW